MALIIRQVLKGYYYLNNEISDPRTHNYPLISTPFPIFAIMAAYYYFALSLGPRIMKNRPPFQLNRVIQVYNAVQIVVSLWIAERALTQAWIGNYNLFCQPVDFSDDPDAVKITMYVYIFFLTKIVDLLDTVFFVLRKKQNQLTFLHLYHHGLMPLCIWCGVKYVPGGHSTFCGLLNSIVHSVMYSYYLITNMYPEYKKNIWWKKYITQMQLLQFFLIFIHMGQLFFQPDCDYPRIIPVLLAPQNLFITLLFYDFYRKTYSQEKIEASLKSP